MDNAPELFRLIAQALALFAAWLDRVFHIPWPLVLAVFFVPLVAGLDVVVWYLRGMAFPIHCGYLKVRGRGRCQRITLGEWHKCWYHRKRRLRRTDKHLVDPDMRRWKTRLNEDATPDTEGVIGRGFLRMRSRQDTLLYHQGFTRPPRDVRKIMPEVLNDYKQRAIERWTSIRSLGWRGLIPLSSRGSQQIATSSVLPGVINATRLTLVMAAFGLIMVGVSIAVPPTITPIFQYVATFSFLFAFAFTRAGIWRTKPQWVGISVKEAAKWIAGFMLIATLSGLYGLFSGEIINVAKTLVETVFTGFILAVILFAALGKRWRFPKRRRRRK